MVPVVQRGAKEGNVKTEGLRTESDGKHPPNLTDRSRLRIPLFVIPLLLYPLRRTLVQLRPKRFRLRASPRRDVQAPSSGRPRSNSRLAIPPKRCPRVRQATQQRHRGAETITRHPDDSESGAVHKLR